MDLRKLARNVCVKVSKNPQFVLERESELKEEIILQGQEIEGLSIEIVDLSRQNELLRHENNVLKDKIKELKTILGFIEMAHDKG